MKKLYLFMIILLAAIFYLSTMTYEQQTIVPQLQTVLKDEPFKEELSKIELTYWNQVISVETRGYIHFVEFLIRKAFHFSGYGLVGVALFLFYNKIRLRYSYLFAILSVFIIGSIDEYIQFHTPGRTGIFQDVVIDTSGAFVFVSIAAIIRLIYRKIKKPRVSA